LLSEYSPASGQIKTFSTSIPRVGASYPYFVYVDPLKGNVWFNEHYGDAIGEFDPSSGQMTEYHLSPGPSSYGNISGVLTMSLADSGTPWFSEVYTGRIGTLNPAAPLNLSLELSGVGPNRTVSVSNKSEATIQVRVTDRGVPVSLSTAVGNASSPLRFGFSPSSGRGSFTSEVTIGDSSTSKGVYFVTISATTGGLTVSRVVEVQSG
jgi:virginiamycin B lyase